MTTQALEHAPARLSLLAKFGERYSLDPRKVYDTLCRTAFAAAQNEEQVVALLVVADQYGLNPFTKEIYAFPDKSGGVVPVVGVDGWNRIAQQHPQFDGVELRYAEKMAQPEGGRPCPEWAEAIVYRKDREHPVIVREYLDECYRPTAPWKSHTKRMLRHKALIQGYRVAFGFHGIYDQDEAERLREAQPADPRPAAPVAERVAERLGLREERQCEPEAVSEEPHYEPVDGELPPDDDLPPEDPPGMGYEEPVAEHQAREASGPRASSALITKLREAADKAGVYEAELMAMVDRGYGVSDLKQLSKMQAEGLISQLQAEPERLEV